MKKLEGHLQSKKSAVKGWDLVSTSLSLAGLALLASACIQPKNPWNGLRIGASLTCFLASVITERVRESDLESLESAIGYWKDITAEKIRRDTVQSAIVDDLEAETQLFRRVPKDKWPEVAAKLGTTPPNFEARHGQIEKPVLKSVEPAVQGTAQAVLEQEQDPCADGYDPEAMEETRELSDAFFVGADKVSEWFEKLGDSCPQSLKDEWLQSPGLGIQIVGSSASIVRREGS